ncbi:MAG: hypothetical protein VYA21_06875, partial [Verrucomicrobiota bacterium]|nr:hypothetical protein [Verrucomicrobiota bacterium]
VDAGRGVIRDETIHDRVLAQIKGFALEKLPCAELIGIMESPIKGTDGNREFLLGLMRGKISLQQ